MILFDTNHWYEENILSYIPYTKTIKFHKKPFPTIKASLEWRPDITSFNKFQLEDIFLYLYFFFHDQFLSSDLLQDKIICNGPCFLFLINATSLIDISVNIVLNWLAREEDLPNQFSLKRRSNKQNLVSEEKCWNKKTSSLEWID